MVSFLQFPAFEQEITACGFRALPSILNANNLPVSNPLSMAEIFGQLVRLNGAVHFQQLKLVVPLQAFQELEFCVGCMTKLHGDCLNLWSWNVIEAISKCGLDCLRTSFVSSSLQTIPTQFQELLCACPLRLVLRDGLWPVLNFVNQLPSTTPKDARLRSTENGLVTLKHVIMGIFFF